VVAAQLVHFPENSRVIQIPAVVAVLFLEHISANTLSCL
jgi:hypothetical protein